VGQVHPAPAGDPDRAAITERNLAAVWANFAAVGCRRLVYTNTASSTRMSRRLAELAVAGTVRVVTDGRSVPGIAREVTALTGWV